MTRDEHRKACIEAMADRALAGKVIYADIEKPHVLEFSRESWIEIMTFAFDSLHDIALVVPVEATEEMIWEGNGFTKDSDKSRQIYSAMSAAGDLTNPPETNP